MNVVATIKRMNKNSDKNVTPEFGVIKAMIVNKVFKDNHLDIKVRPSILINILLRFIWE